MAPLPVLLLMIVILSVIRLLVVRVLFPRMSKIRERRNWRKESWKERRRENRNKTQGSTFSLRLRQKFFEAEKRGIVEDFSITIPGCCFSAPARNIYSFPPGPECIWSLKDLESARGSYLRVGLYSFFRHYANIRGITKKERRGIAN